MFQIYNGRKAFWQWDSGQRLLVLDERCQQVHFQKENDTKALVCPITEEDGQRFVRVPDALLQSAQRLYAYALVEEDGGFRVLDYRFFDVYPRAKPEDYICTETEHWTVEQAVADAVADAVARGDFKGEQGDKGEKGDKGDNGLSPHIGENHNWWIGNADTGVAAVGELSKEETEDFGTTVALDEYTIGSVANNVRFALNPTTREGRLKSITMKLTGNGAITVYLCTYVNGKLSFITKFPVTGAYGIKEYVNGVDFEYNGTLPVGTVVGMTAGAAAPSVYYYADTEEKSLNVQASVAEGVDQSVSTMSYGVSLKATIGYEVNALDEIHRDIAALKHTPSRYLIDQDFSEGFGDFTATNYQTSTGGVQNTSAGWDTQLVRTIRTDFDSRGMAVRFIPKSGDALLVIGNKNASNLAASTFYGVDFGAKQLAIYPNWNNDTAAPVPPATQASNLTLAADREYILEYRRQTLFKGKVILRDCLTGESESFEIANNALKGWDNPCVIVPAGTVEVKRVQYFHTMPIEAKLAVYGDSFIEGANLGYGSIDKRYVQRIADAIGEDVFLDGRGGESAAGVLQKYPTDSLCKAQYTLIAVGTNDYTYNTWLSNIQSIIAFVEAKGSVPVLVTVSRRTDTDNLSFIQQANAWVRSSGYAYLDVAKAISLNNDGETINTELYYSDNVHPNVAGHQAIFNRSRIDLPFLYLEGYGNAV